MAAKAKKAVVTKAEAKKPVQAESEPQKGGLVRVRSKTLFYDKEAQRHRNINEEWDIAKERLKEIQAVEKATKIELIEVL